MPAKSRKSETVKVSRLGCMRKSTVESDFAGKTVEHVELWTGQELNDTPKAKKIRNERV
jgi:hypothetical protein